MSVDIEAEIDRLFREYDERLHGMELSVGRLERERDGLRGEIEDVKAERDELRGWVDRLLKVVQRRNVGGVGDGF